MKKGREWGRVGKRERVGESGEVYNGVNNILYSLPAIAELAHIRPCHGDQSHPGHHHTPRGPPYHPQNDPQSQELLPPVKTMMV